MVITPQAYNSYQYTYNMGQPRRQKGITTSPKEIKHLAVAAALIVGIGFSIGLYTSIPALVQLFGSFPFQWTLGMIAVFAVILVVSMLTHEMAHKTMAQKNGLWAEFRLTTWGIVITFISIFLPFRMISPGAMMIAGSPNGDEIVKISIVGPLTNLAFSSALLAAAFYFPPAGFGGMLFFASYINAFMAVFNLIPFGILDGYKIFSFNKTLWALAFIPSVALAVFTFLHI